MGDHGPGEPGDGDREGGGNEGEGSGASRLDGWIAPCFTDSLLWPVTFTVAAVFATFMASVLLLSFRDRNLPAMAALVGLVWLSVEPLRGAIRRRSLGPAAGAVLLFWGLAVGIALIGLKTGFL
jgi:hypothetical protein